MTGSNHPRKARPEREAEERVPSLSGKEALVLELLLENPTKEMYGLEMVAGSRNRLKRGTVYVTLDRMEDKGYVESRQEKPRPDQSGLPRRLYRVTGYGQKVFEIWEMARNVGHMRAELGGVS